MQFRANDHVTAAREKNEKENRKAPGPVFDPRVRVCYLPQPHNGGCVIAIRFFGDVHSIKYTTIKKNVFNTKMAAAIMKHMIETTI